ncbi:MAG: helix-turn-helix domain-containing protein [Treponema sp.]|jgi:transcriptional regulator with XRE-family HTH domain|nr:helix-turn-helix domain-containing protein [Treponema sp.]
MTGTNLRQILSKNIKLLRSKRSLSQEELAEKANISIPFLSNIERSNKWPYPDTLVKLAKALDVEVFMLFQENSPPKPDNIQNTLSQFKKDLAVSLHKTVTVSIDNSLETISAHYIGGKPEKL